MPFLCPVCRTATMVPTPLEPDLPADRCSTCGGFWITSPRYFSYLALVPEASASRRADIPARPDSPVVKMCPACLKFMRYYPVGHDLAFGIDKCNTCGGVFLHAGEWEALAAHGFERHLHAISSDTWQAEIAHQRRIATERQLLIKRLGPADFAELERVSAWLANHPHRAELLAHLQQYGQQPGRD